MKIQIEIQIQIQIQIQHDDDLSEGTDEQGSDELGSSVESGHHKGREEVAHGDHHLLYQDRLNTKYKIDNSKNTSKNTNTV